MSDFFHDKSYNEYFEKLNNRINSTETKHQPIKNKSPQKKRGIYKVIKIRRRAVALGLILVVLGVIFFSVRGCSKEKPQNRIKQNIVTEQKKENEAKSQITVFKTNDNTASIPQSNDAKTGVIIRLSDKMIVANRGMHDRIYPASTLKIMTLLTAVEHITDLDDTFTMTYEITDPLYVAEASVAGFLNNEVVTLRDLLYGMILPSGADGAMGLAIKIAGSEKAFVKLMNQKAKDLGLENTHFTNVSGLYDKDNYSSSYDIAVILYTAMQNEICRKILSTYQYTTEKTPQNPDGILLSSTLFTHMYGTEPETATILGGKTGYVNEAGYCVASFGKANDSEEEYIVITMGNSSKWPAFYGQIDLYKEFAK